MRRYQLVTTLSLTTLSCGMAIFTVFLRKKRKKGSVGEEDILSQLPDEVAASIMARLPAKAMGTMSTVSKRCRHLCKLVTRLKFSCFDLLRFQEYGHWYELLIHRSIRCLNLYRFQEDYAYHKLDHHRRHCCELLIGRLISILKLRRGYEIGSLQLDCCIPKRSDFKKCLSHLQHSGVESLYLKFACGKGMYHEQLCFPLDHLHLLPRLNLLRLSLCVLKQELGCKSHSLHTLELKSVKVSPAALECILSGCLTLNSLSLHHCDCPSRISISGQDLALKSLEIQYCKGVEEIELHASNLTALDFKSQEMVNFIFDHVPQLQTLYFSVLGKNSTPRVHEASDKDLPNLRTLTLVTTGSFYQESSKLMRLGARMFMELRQLSLYVCCMSEINLVSLIIPILRSCPLLSFFCLDLKNLSYEEGPAMRSGFSHPHPSLKQVRITGFSGKEKEIGLALCILHSAVRLDEMIILWSRSSSYYKSCCALIIWEDRKKWDEESIIRKIQGRAISKNARVFIENVHARTPSRSAFLWNGYGLILT